MEDWNICVTRIGLARTKEMIKSLTRGFGIQGRTFQFYYSVILYTLSRCRNAFVEEFM